MRARILPLDGKYYGTDIEIICDMDGSPIKTGFTVWESWDYVPSDRELASWDLTREDWDNDKQVYDGWGGIVGCRTSGDIVCDGHFESEWTYNLCKKLVNCINSSETNDHKPKKESHDV